MSSGYLLYDILSPTLSWIKVTKTFSDLSAASLTNDIEVLSLPAKGVIHAVEIVPTTAFTGGLIATYTISVGIAGNFTKYRGATNVFTGFTLPTPAANIGMESTTVATSIRAQAISTVGLLNAATQGSADIYLLVSNLN